MSSRTTAHTATTDTMIGASLGNAKLNVEFFAVVNDDDS